jgi:hypothetical protein
LFPISISNIAKRTYVSISDMEGRVSVVATRCGVVATPQRSSEEERAGFRCASVCGGAADALFQSNPARPKSQIRLMGSLLLDVAAGSQVFCERVDSPNRREKNMGITHSPLKTYIAVFLLALGMATPACSDAGKLDGVYVNGQNSVEFRDGKAFITMVGMASDGVPYDVKGTTISVHAGGIAGDLVLTKNSDGTLQGPFGIMRRKAN